jgi:hypothetical protein
VSKLLLEKSVKATVMVYTMYAAYDSTRRVQLYFEHGTAVPGRILHDMEVDEQNFQMHCSIGSKYTFLCPIILSRLEYIGAAFVITLSNIVPKTSK